MSGYDSEYNLFSCLSRLTIFPQHLVHFKKLRFLLCIALTKIKGTDLYELLAQEPLDTWMDLNHNTRPVCAGADLDLLCHSSYRC